VLDRNCSISGDVYPAHAVDSSRWHTATTLHSRQLQTDLHGRLGRDTDRGTMPSKLWVGWGEIALMARLKTGISIRNHHSHHLREVYPFESTASPSHGFSQLSNANPFTFVAKACGQPCQWPRVCRPSSYSPPAGSRLSSRSLELNFPFVSGAMNW
jgi:hypothetical protein